MAVVGVALSPAPSCGSLAAKSLALSFNSILILQEE